MRLSLSLMLHISSGSWRRREQARTRSRKVGGKEGREQEGETEERRLCSLTSLLLFLFLAPSDAGTSTVVVSIQVDGRRRTACRTSRNTMMQGGGPLSPDEHRLSSPSSMHQPASTIVVAVDRDRNSQLAMKWVVDHLLAGASHVVLLHVVSHHPATNHGFAMAETTQDSLEAEMKEIFAPHRGFFSRNGVQQTEVVLEEADVAKAIIEYVTANKIQSIVLGASNRNAFTKKWKNSDVPSSLMKGAPDYCNIYVVAKGKSVSVRLANCGVPIDDTDFLGGGLARRSSRGHLPPVLPESASSTRSIDRCIVPELTTRPPFRERSISASATKTTLYADGGSYGELDLGQKVRFSSIDLGNNLDVSTPSTSPRECSSPLSGTQREVEVEMQRLRLELRQTMDMYNAACKEAINAKQRVKEMHLLNVEEARRLEEAQQAEEAALAQAEMEKVKCRAATEAAEAAQRLADVEGQRRRNAEVRARREADEKVRALDAIASQDTRYRKYHIDEIEMATERFSESLKIGEGGYGPVYRAYLDHTPVAIKVLRPDAQQGRKQFQQEVDVLSCIRHPNMVLLLGACPEYGCLVYEHMDNGSLEDRLFRRGGTPPIPWSQRFRISAEIATALLFLHQTRPEPLVHRDLKPGNILLDRNYVSKISDVGLARLVPPAVTESVTRYRLTATAGTFCYIDPEYQQTGKLGVKSDIYSLGVLLLQVITARPPMGLTHHVEKAIEAGTFDKMLDITVKDWPVDEALGFAKIALKCTEMRRRDRPDLATVVLPELNRLRNLGHAYDAARSVTAAGDGSSHGTSNVNSSTADAASWRTAES